jgi:hypothetical protein
MSESVQAATGLLFVAFCIWLTVRIVNRRERWAKRTAIVVAAVLLYVLSLGPLIWLDSRGMLNDTAIDVTTFVWWPCLLLIEDEDGSGALYPPLDRYADLWFGTRP